jgi:lysozyme
MSGRRRINEETKALIKRLEGLKLEAYRDVAGVWTIGYGTTAGVYEGQKISEAVADHLLDSDLRKFEEGVDDLVEVELTDNQFGALVSFAYNVGLGALQRSTLLKKLNTGNYGAVPGELMKWNKARVDGQLVVVQGLVNRRAAEAGLWARGAFATGREVAPSAPASVGAQAAAQVAGVGGVGVVATVLPALAGLDWRVGLAIVLVAALGAAIHFWRKA